MLSEANSDCGMETDDCGQKLRYGVGWWQCHRPSLMTGDTSLSIQGTMAAIQSSGSRASGDVMPSWWTLSVISSWSYSRTDARLIAEQVFGIARVPSAIPWSWRIWSQCGCLVKTYCTLPISHGAFQYMALADITSISIMPVMGRDLLCGRDWWCQISFDHRWWYQYWQFILQVCVLDTHWISLIAWSVVHSM